MSRPVKERQPENRWTPEEDEILIAAVERCGPIIVWSQVSACLPGRNNKSCRKRWIHSLDPTLRKGRWTEDEDSILISAVETYGTHWFQVAKLLPGRTDDQCAKRWRENLDPAISRKPWTKAEDEILMETFERLGKRWKEIASRFEGRPPVHCRNRVQSLVRARRRAAKVRMAGGNKGKNKRPTYDEVMTTDSPISSDLVDDWANIERCMGSNFDQGTPESLEVESVSSASGDLSISPPTPSSHTPETLVEVSSNESIHSAVGSLLRNYTSAPSSSPQQFYQEAPLASSLSYTSSLDWATNQYNAEIEQPLGTPWEKSIATSYDPNFAEWLGPWNSSTAESHLISTNPPSLVSSSSVNHHGHALQPSLRHHPYHSHSHFHHHHNLSHNHHQQQQHHQGQHHHYHAGHTATTHYGQLYGSHHSSMQAPSYLVPPQVNARQLTAASFPSALSS